MSSDGERDPLLRSVNSEVNYNTENFNDYRSQEYVTSRLTFRTNNQCLQIFPGIMILVLVLLERIAYYSLTGNLYLFLHEHKFHWLYYNAIGALLLFTGVSYLASLFGGWLSDAYFGRFKTIGFAFLLFNTAYWFLFGLTYDNIGFCGKFVEPWINMTHGNDSEIPDKSLFNENCASSVLSILIFAAIGTGVIKANIAPFGAEQVRHTGADGLKIYLNWLYWCVNIGALIAILVITYVQQISGFKIGYVIPASLLAFATLIFWISYPLYTHQLPSGSSISRIYYVIKEAWQSGHRIMIGNSSSASVNRPDWLDMAKVRYGGKFHESVVEDVKSLSAIIKVFVLLIPYWILYFQMQTTFLAQGLQMRLNFGPSNSSSLEEKQKFTIPAAWLMLFNVIFLIIFIPILNHVIYPCLNRRGIQINMLTRIAIGMVCAASSMAVAGCLEIYRFNLIKNHQTVKQVIENTTFVAADMTILWQIPQYSLIGISEVFASVSGMEFACSQAPSRMQGAVMGFYYFCTGVGSFLGLALLEIFEKIINTHYFHGHASDINEGNLYCFFFFLASIQLITVIIFIYVSKFLKIRRLPSSNRTSSDISNVRS